MKVHTSYFVASLWGNCASHIERCIIIAMYHLNCLSITLYSDASFINIIFCTRVA